MGKPLIGGGKIFLINLLSLFILQYVLTEDFDYKLFLFRVGPFMYWIAYYALGMYLSKSDRDYSLPIPFVILITGYLAQFAETYFFGIGIDLPVAILIYSCGMILVLFSKRTEALFNKIDKHLGWLASVGRYSFVIYLIHLYVLMAFNRIVDVKIWIVSWVCVILLSYVSVWFIDKVLPQNLKHYFGLN